MRQGSFSTQKLREPPDFDLDLAVKQSNENPVYYVQYAHARICSMLRLLESEGISVPVADEGFTLLAAPEEINLMKSLRIS